MKPVGEGNGVSGLKVRMAAKPFAAWAVFGGLAYAGLAIVGYSAPYLLGGGVFVLVFLAFAAILFLGAFAGLTARRWGFAVAAGVGIFFLLLLGLFATSNLSSPANPLFWLAISALPALLLGSGFGLLSAVHGKQGVTRRPYLASPRSTGGLFTFAVIGFIVGVLLVGTIGAMEITRILAAGGQVADIRIVQGASSGAAEPFSPRTFIVAHGTAVTWFNADAMEHSVTSNTTGLWDSGLINSGSRWSHIFDTPGTYAYHCSPHPWMTGTIVVT